MFGTTIIGAMMLAGATAPPATQHTTSPFATEATRPGNDANGESPVDSVAIASDQTWRMTVLVNIAGRGPFSFLVDTGSERTAISRQLATQLNLTVGSPARVHSVLGSEVVPTVHIPGLSVGKRALSVINAPIFEARHIGADGVLGIDSLRSQRVMFDFKAGEMQITPSRPKDYGRAEKDTIVVQARARGGRLILTNVTVDGVNIAAIIDTGSQVSIGNYPLLRRLRRSRDVVIRRDQRGIIHAVTGEARQVEMMRVEKLKLGGVELQDVGIAFDNSRIFERLGYGNRPALLLGIDALRAFDKISIDFAQKKVRFVLPGIGMIDGYRTAAR